MAGVAIHTGFHKQTRWRWDAEDRANSSWQATEIRLNEGTLYNLKTRSPHGHANPDSAMCLRAVQSRGLGALQKVKALTLLLEEER